MKKLHLVAMSYDRDRVLNALARTGAAEVRMHVETELTHALPPDGEALRAYCASLETALSTLSAEADRYRRDHKLKSVSPADGFPVTRDEFVSAGERKEEAESLVARVGALKDGLNSIQTEQNRTRRLIAQAEPYAAVKTPLSAFGETACTLTRLGIVNAGGWEKLSAALKELPLAESAVYAEKETVVFSVTAHRSCIREVDKLLAEVGFSACPFSSVQTGEELYSSFRKEEKRLLSEREENGRAFYELSAQLRGLKIYTDFVGFLLEKAELSEKLRATDKTFLLEAYVPAEAEARVAEALAEVSGALFTEFSSVPEDEVPPTLLKNNAVVENFETITNMYSPPSSREFDPNTVMAFFYSLFLGFIMADIFYGALMLVGGGIIWGMNRGKKSGLKSLAGVFAVGGIFALLWGVLFNSLAGVAVLPFTVMPDAQKGMWSFAGINVPSVLVIAMLIGVFQLMTGYICRAVQCFRRALVWDGVLDGLVWAVFSAGVGVLIVGLIDEFSLGALAPVGAVAAGASLFIAVCTAGRKEKLFGKFTKGFGALYGVINYISDILSYARLYGLMLSGAVIAQIVSQYAVQFISTSVLLAIVGVLLMIIGHAFNLAIGLLGAYIHDARLQYVEFYGRFYEGEGELFTPLGSVHKYVRIAPRERAEESEKG